MFNCVLNWNWWPLSCYFIILVLHILMNCLKLWHFIFSAYWCIFETALGKIKIFSRLIHLIFWKNFYLISFSLKILHTSKMQFCFFIMLRYHFALFVRIWGFCYLLSNSCIINSFRVYVFKWKFVINVFQITLEFCCLGLF